MCKLLKKVDYRYLLSIIILIGIICLSFNFLLSYTRLFESLKDLFNSFIYYFCTIFNIPHDPNLTIKELSSTSPDIVSSFNIVSFNNFQSFFDISFNLSFNIETLFKYFNKILEILSHLTRFLLLLFPLLLLLYLKYRSYFQENNHEMNHDSIPLKIYKLFELKIYTPIKNWIINFYHFFFDKKIFKYIFILMFCIYFNFITIFIEFIAFYLYLVVSFDFISIFKQVYKLFLDLIPMFKFVPFIIWLILLIIIFNRIRKKIGYSVLQHYEMRDRGYINSLGQVCLICAPMGKGKTTLLTDMALSTEIMFRDKAFELILENDLKFPFFPYIVFEKEIQKAIAFHQIYNLATARIWIRKKRDRFEKTLDKRKCFDYDFKKYGLFYDDNLKNMYLFDMLESYVQLYFIYIIQSSLLVTNYSIREDNVLQDLGNFPIWHSDFFKKNTEFMNAYSRHSHILDFDMLRLGKKVIEKNYKANVFEFGVVVITEGGKERKNMFELKETKKNADETNQKNDLFNLWLKMVRHSATIDNYPFIKVFIDEQRPESLGADVRELCERVVFIRDKEDKKSSLLLFNFETMIYNFLMNKFNSLYYRYRFVRSDNTLFLYLFKKIISSYNHYYHYLLNTFSYSKLKIESEKGILDDIFDKNTYYIMDKKIYSSRFSTACFSDYFEYKSLNSPIGLNDLEEFKTEKASIDELVIQNSYFINDITESFYDHKE